MKTKLRSKIKNREKDNNDAADLRRCGFATLRICDDAALRLCGVATFIPWWPSNYDLHVS